MTAQATATPTGEHPNGETIAGLLAIAEWLSERPDLPPMRVLVHGRADFSIVGGCGEHENPRDQMTRFAESLDCRVVESVEFSDVQITGEIGPRARVQLRTTVASLGGQPRTTPQFDYEPITETCSECDGKPVTRPFWHHPFPPTCPACNGATKQLREPAAAIPESDQRAA